MGRHDWASGELNCLSNLVELLSLLLYLIWMGNGCVFPKYDQMKSRLRLFWRRDLGIYLDLYCEETWC